MQLECRSSVGKAIHINDPQNMIIATWNVMLPVAARRRVELRAHIDAIAPEILVLTETHDGFDAGLPYKHPSAPGRDGLQGHEHRWATICSRYPMHPIETSDPARTAAALIMRQQAVPLLIYGTVLPWIGSTWREYPSVNGQAFAASLEIQVNDWIMLRSAHPDAEIFVAGDFNQDLVTPRYYGSQLNRARLEEGLERAGLVAYTAGAHDPIRRDSPPCACIDHIAGRLDSRFRIQRTRRWPESVVPSKALSDHFGVAVELVET